MRASSVLVTASLALLGGCSGASPNSGQTAWMRIQGAQYIPGSIDTETSSASPEVHSLSTQNNDLFPGVTGKSISGTVGPASTGVLVGLLGDSGHWAMPVQEPDYITPGDFNFACNASFSPLTRTSDGGALSLVVRATDGNGVAGPALVQPMIMEAARPEAALLVMLDWDTQADLDLHVEIPLPDGGVEEIWSRKPSGLGTGQTGATVEESMAAGYLDRDSNSQCVIDGNRVERVLFPSVVPRGRYTVRVDTFSLCAEATARWRVRVYIQGSESPLHQAFGQSTNTDTRYSHGQGAGVQALVFDYNP